LERYDVLSAAGEGAVLLLNSPHPSDQVWENLPRPVQQQIRDKRLKLYVIDAYQVARETAMGSRINTVMQTCFFAISGVLPRDEAIAKIKESIKKTYGNRGEAVVRQNYAAVDAALAHLHEVETPLEGRAGFELQPAVPANAPEFVRRVTAQMIAGRGDALPVSAFPVDGTYPTGTAQWEKRSIAQEVPVWESDLCIQCGKCVMVCPHSTIRAKVYEEVELARAPESFKHMPSKWRELQDRAYTIQVAVEDCTGCRLCVEVCPAKDKSQVSRKALNMHPQAPLRDRERANWDFFLDLPDAAGINGLSFGTVKNAQLLQPLFEFSGACAGCGETPYVRLVTQLFGDRAIIANATGCSSIYGGNLPTTPYTTNAEGRGPAWSNSLFEDNAEFGLGMRLALDHQRAYAEDLVERMRDRIGDALATSVLTNDQSTSQGINIQRQCVKALQAKLRGLNEPELRDLSGVAEALVEKSVWIIGGDGWAYDIGYGGLDHVLASGRNVNVLVLDTEVYSNTGGQASKATPLAAVAKYASGGKQNAKKDLGLTAMRYGNVYVAQVAMGADDAQTLKTFREAEAYRGPSLIIAYSHCIAHGIDMSKGMHQQKLAVDSGHWPLYRFDPRRTDQGKNPLQLDSGDPKIPLRDYIYKEGRYRILVNSDPAAAKTLLERAELAVHDRWQHYKQMAESRDGG
ncbi:MAG TPA: pyruvate:ferredoxin (flavodoxin) oxidoreductase, partial [Blastocatellia bacterium]|nr:pyruvate:ferredoxin (flavodoxin) oxidoreductase [Blastocatellia bacterium]